MFREVQQQLALNYQQLERDQADIMARLKQYKNNACQDLLITEHDLQNSSVLQLSNSIREQQDHKRILDMQTVILELEEDRAEKERIICDLKRNNLNLRKEIDQLKGSIIQTHSIMDEISHQRDSLLGQLKKSKVEFSSKNSFLDADVVRSKSISQHTSTGSNVSNQQEKLINCIKDMMCKLQPNVYQEIHRIQLKDCWRWLKILMNDYVQLATLIKDLSRTLNVDQKMILMEVKQLIRLVVNKR